MKAKKPWWQVTTRLRLALLVGGGYLIVGLGGLAFWIVSGKVWEAVIWGLYLVCGTPWYITAAVLVKRRREVASNEP
jgi:hypothetical protein